MFKEKSDTKMLGEQGEGRQQEFEVKDLRKALPRSFHLTSVFGGGREGEGFRPINIGALGK